MIATDGIIVIIMLFSKKKRKKTRERESVPYVFSRSLPYEYSGSQTAQSVDAGFHTHLHVRQIR